MTTSWVGQIAKISAWYIQNYGFFINGTFLSQSHFFPISLYSHLLLSSKSFLAYESGWQNCDNYNTFLTYIDNYGKITLQRKKIILPIHNHYFFPKFSKLVQVGSKLWLYGKGLGLSYVCLF